MAAIKLSGLNWQAWWARLRPRAGEAPVGPLPVRDGSAIGRSPAGHAVRLSGFDQTLVAVALALVLLGVVMVYSATLALPESKKYMNFTQTHFLMRHLLSIGIGLVAALVVLRLPMSFWEKYAPWIFVIALVLLLLVLIPGIGKVVNKSRRWIPLGVMNFQPSELAKLAMAMYAASYMVRKMDLKEDFVKAVWPMALALGFTGFLLLREPDMGAFMVVAAVSMGILFLGGVNGRMFFLSVGVLAGTFATVIAFSPEKRSRIFAYLEPWDPAYVQEKSYQLTNSLIAFGRGRIFGRGLGDSVEKLHYLPEPHTDFLLAVIGEELGLLGVTAVIVLFFWLTRRIMLIGRQAIALDRVYAGLMVQGVGVWLGFQAFINMGVNLGLLPTKGLTLPLMSYGGSAILLNFIALAMVLRADMENRTLMRGGRA